MDSGDRRNFSVRHPVVVDAGCSCQRTRSIFSLFTTKTTKFTTRKPNLSPQTQPNHRRTLSPSATSFSKSHNGSSFTTTTTAFQSGEHQSSSAHSRATTKNTHFSNNKMNPRGRVVKESVAVVKESQDPYHDFRDSMLQMILEKELYGVEDLRELLHRFLTLNSSYHHESILKAFTEIWNEIFAGGKVYTGDGRRKQSGLGH